MVMHTELLLDVEGLSPEFSFFWCLQELDSVISAVKCCVRDGESFNHFRQVVKLTS